MEHNFWHNKWEKKEIGFHLNEVNPLMMKYFSVLALPQNSRIFVPLCGKTLDIHWLLQQGYRVAGAELSEVAIEQLFDELGVQPEVSDLGKLKHFKASNIDIYVGDIFNLNHDLLGHVDAIYDRAALIALPESMRTRYTAQLMQLTQSAPQLMICLEYDQSQMDGPPFSISEAEVKLHYQPHYDIKRLSSTPVKGGLKGGVPSLQHVWLLSKNQ